MYSDFFISMDTFFKLVGGSAGVFIFQALFCVGVLLAEDGDDFTPLTEWNLSADGAEVGTAPNSTPCTNIKAKACNGSCGIRCSYSLNLEGKDCGAPQKKEFLRYPEVSAAMKGLREAYKKYSDGTPSDKNCCQQSAEGTPNISCMTLKRTNKEALKDESSCFDSQTQLGQRLAVVTLTLVDGWSCLSVPYEVEPGPTVTPTATATATPTATATATAAQKEI